MINKTRTMPPSEPEGQNGRFSPVSNADFLGLLPTKKPPTRIC